MMLIDEIQVIKNIVEGIETSLNFNDLSVYERVKVVNELPLSLNNSIIDYISGVKEVEDKCLTFLKTIF